MTRNFLAHGRFRIASKDITKPWQTETKLFSDVVACSSGFTQNACPRLCTRIEDCLEPLLYIKDILYSPGSGSSFWLPINFGLFCEGCPSHHTLRKKQYYYNSPLRKPRKRLESDTMKAGACHAQSSRSHLNRDGIAMPATAYSGLVSRRASQTNVGFSSVFYSPRYATVKTKTQQKQNETAQPWLFLKNSKILIHNRNEDSG